MPVPSTIADLSTTAGSNSPLGSETVTISVGPDEYVRTLSAFIRREQAQGAAVASAATVNIGAIADGNYVHITGVTTITSFGTIAAGISRTVVFDGILTLTHNATSLILKTGANRTTAVGDVARFVSEGAGNWREVAYHAVVAASNIANTPAGNIAATTVQAALNELDAEKALLAGSPTQVFSASTFTGALSGNATTATTATTANTVAAAAFASSAENIAGTIESKPVDPLGIREAFNATGTAPIYACRSWVNFNGTGVVAIRASGNVSSITDNGVGDYTVNFTTAMPDVNYGWSVGGGFNATTSANGDVTAPAMAAPTTTAFRMATLNTAGGAVDFEFIGISFFR